MFSIFYHSPPSAESSWPPPPPLPRVPGMGGLFRYSLTLRQYSSSLSVFGSFREMRDGTASTNVTWADQVSQFPLSASFRYILTKQIWNAACQQASRNTLLCNLLLTCIQKNSLLEPALNFSTYTRPVVHWFTRLNSQSSGNIIRSWNTKSRHWYPYKTTSVVC